MHAGQISNNYTDGTAMLLGHNPGGVGGGARQTGMTSHSQGPAMGQSHKTLYMSQQERMHEIGKVYNY